METKNNITENAKYFELISMDKEKLIGKIPIKSDKTNIGESEEAKEIKKYLEELEIKKISLIEVVSSIFNTLNENNIVTDFVKVLQKKTTENAIFNEKKLEYDEKFKQLETLSDEIKQIKNNITEKVEIFNKLKENVSKLSQENENVNFILNFIKIN